MSLKMKVIDLRIMEVFWLLSFLSPCRDTCAPLKMENYI